MVPGAMEKLPKAGQRSRAHLQDVGDDVLLTLLQKSVFVEVGVDLQDLSQHLRHLRLGEEPTCPTSSDFQHSRETEGQAADGGGGGG